MSRSRLTGAPSTNTPPSWRSGPERWAFFSRMVDELMQGWRWVTGRPPVPIAILSFDRPHYLCEVLHSLCGQVSVRDEILLFQDGPINPSTGQLKTTPERIQQCIRVFQRLIPWGTVLAAEGNNGIAFNYDRAENYLFKKLGRPHALFLEDDLVLSPVSYRDSISPRHCKKRQARRLRIRLRQHVGFAG
jgi:hypothetical protein